MTDLQPAPGRTVAIAASFTVEPILPGLRLVLDEAGLDVSVSFAPYNQLFQQLLSRTNLLASNPRGVNVILVRMEDFVRDTADVGSARALLKRTTREFADALTHFESHAKSPTVLAVLKPSPTVNPELIADLENGAAVVSACARELRGIYPLTLEQIERLSRGQTYDPLRDELAHIPYTDEYFACIALAVARKVHALLVPAHKVLVLDCDNTLWTGVVGEDGVAGVEVSKSQIELQRFAIERQASGTLLCLASKNSEQDVLDVLSTRNEMALKHEHIVAHRINWKSKPENIASLANELNLGLDSFVFIDDNPVECAQVRSALPQVVTLQLPTDAHIPTFLANLWVFDKVSVTVEDTVRTKMYRENAARQSLEASTTDISEFISSLNLSIDIAPPADGEWTRVAQLTQRTNQFNFTTVRRTEPELRVCAAKDSLILRVNVKDRFGDYGLVGVIVADTSETSIIVNTMLLSCRVLGRGVEHAMLQRLGAIARDRGLSIVELPFIPTSKNEPAGAFADSVASAFRKQKQDAVVYTIPAEFAGAIVHRPGHDPDAVIKARESEGKKSGLPGTLPVASLANRSERYATLASILTSGQAVSEAVRKRNLSARTLTERPEGPATQSERKLAALWKEILNVDELGVNDDYFALGGTSLLAVEMFAQISRQFGVRFPLTTILESPTVRSLALRIERQGVSQPDTIIELKRGGVNNLFLIHDGDGETLLYRNLARRMPDDFTVFGVEPRRLSGVPLAHTRIEHMARFYIEELRSRQPKGPYMLGGLCAGGVIAYEMASQLQSAGESVKLVALLDAAKPNARRRAGQISRQRVRRLEAVFAGVRGEHGILVPRLYSSIKEAATKLRNFAAWEFSSRARRLTTRIRFRLLHELLERGRSWPPFLPALSVREIYDSAEARYIPKVISNAGVVLLRAQSGRDLDQPYREVYADDTFDWGTVAEDLAVVDVTGGHSSMLQEPFVESLAKALIPTLMSAQPQTHAQKLANDFTNAVSLRYREERSAP